MIRTVYLAGPEVFYPDATAIGQRKRALCKARSLEGLFPLDNEIGVANSAIPQSFAIYLGNVDMMRRADAIIANLTPFRGPSGDIGTAFEVGFFAALQKPIFVYSNDPRSLIARTQAMFDLLPNAFSDSEGRAIEDYALPDNLMLPGAVKESGGEWIEGQSGDPLDLAAFEECLARIAERNRRDHRFGAAA